MWINYLRNWDQALGLTISDCSETDAGALLFYFDSNESYLEVESCDPCLPVVVQPIKTSSTEPEWLEPATLKGKEIERALVPYCNSNRYDGKVRLTFSDGSEVYITSELERTPVRIT